jgi:hypothetical protein
MESNGLSPQTLYQLMIAGYPNGCQCRREDARSSAQGNDCQQAESGAPCICSSGI